MALDPGTRLGCYEIIGPLGAGGMGEVYQARDTRLGRHVAIKVLPESLAKSVEARQRLEREARAVAGLGHPHICALYDIGEHDGQYFLVLEHLEGRTLGARIRESALPLEEALEIAREIADALHQAHRQGVIHRDLKPENVMLTKSGAKLLDFGLASSTGAEASNLDFTAARTEASPLTVEGSLLGTPAYMAPERLEGHPADARSDVFAFGVLLHEMMTGQRAFTGKTRASVIAAILRETPRPVSELVPTVPPELDRLIQLCLSKNPDDRRQTMKDVLLDLEWIGEQASRRTASGPAARHRTRWVTWTLAAVSTFLAVVVVFRLTSHPTKPFSVIRAMIPPPERAVFQIDLVTPGPPVVSPDGRRMTFAARERDQPVCLWVRDLDALDARPLAGTDGGGYPFWSPDGRSLGFFSQGKLKRLDLDVGGVLDLCDAPTGKGGTWNRDGTILFAPAFNSGIHRVSADGGESTPVTMLNEAEGEDSHRFPFFLPDGRHFLYVIQVLNVGSRSVVHIGSLESPSSHRLVESDSQAIYVSGHLLYLIDENLVAQPFDPVSLDLTGEAFRVAEGVALLSGTARGCFSASNQGLLVYQPAPKAKAMELVWVDRRGETSRSLGQLAGPFDSMAMAPDGSRVALAVPGGPGQEQDLWLYDTQTGQKTRFTFGASATQPVWSPDGESLVFMASIEGTLGLCRKSLSGSGITQLDVPLAAPKSWSPDGRFIALMVPGEETGADLWMLRLSDSEEPYPYLRTKNLEVNPRFSPDGKWIAYASNETQTFEVYVASFENADRRWQVSTRGGQSPRWRGDGKELYFVGPGPVLMASRIDTEGGEVRVESTEELFALDSQSQQLWPGYGVASDGSEFLIQRPASGEDLSTTSLVVVSDWRRGSTD